MLQRPLDTADLEGLHESRERTGPPVLWLSCEGQTDVWELISDISILSAIDDRQGLRVAAPVDLRTKKAEGFSPQALQGSWSKIKNEQFQDRCDVPDCFNRKHQTKEVIWQQYRL